MGSMKVMELVLEKKPYLIAVENAMMENHTNAIAGKCKKHCSSSGGWCCEVHAVRVADGADDITPDGIASSSSYCRSTKQTTVAEDLLQAYGLDMDNMEFS